MCRHLYYEFRIWIISRHFYLMSLLPQIVTVISLISDVLVGCNNLLFQFIPMLSYVNNHLRSYFCMLCLGFTQIQPDTTKRAICFLLWYIFIGSSNPSCVVPVFWRLSCVIWGIHCMTTWGTSDSTGHWHRSRRYKFQRL